MASLSETISSLFGGSGNGNNGSKPFKNKRAALEAIFTEVGGNLEACANGRQFQTQAWDALNAHSQTGLLQDPNGTLLAAQRAYREVQVYTGILNIYQQALGAEKPKQFEMLAAKQAELLQTLRDLKWRLRQAYGQ